MAGSKGPAADSADAEEPTPKGWPMFTFFGSGPPYVNQDANVTTPEETAVNIQVLMNAEDSRPLCAGDRHGHVLRHGHYLL